jgi:hypothetical protein
MTRLHVNVDHVATLRQARGAAYPDPIPAASICEMAGAQGITIHLREDRRHIVDRDLELMRKVVTTVLNLEMAATDEMVGIACRVLPDMCTLVPEKREERTTEGGLAVEEVAEERRVGVERPPPAAVGRVEGEPLRDGDGPGRPDPGRRVLGPRGPEGNHRQRQDDERETEEPSHRLLPPSGPAGRV